jgi:uncharacterized protein YkwD
MKTGLYLLFLFTAFTGLSNRYIKHFGSYRQDSYYKEKVYAEQDVNTFFQIKDIQQTVTIDSVDIHLLDACLFFAANKLRAMHQLPLLIFSDKLQNAAAMHSYQMSVHHFFAHENTYVNKLKDPELRIRYAGIRSTATAENCWKQSLDADDTISYMRLAEEIIEGWYQSPGHRSNLMSRQVKFMAVIAARESYHNEAYIVVTQDFCN